MTVNRKDAGAAAIFLAIAAFFGIGGLMQPLGTLTRMGPGFFPLALACILALLGILIMARGLRRADEELQFAPLRGFLVLLPPLVFALTVRGLGLGPSLVLVVLIATLANPGMSLATRTLVSLIVTVFCVAVFSWGLGMSLAIFGPWVPW